jgi:hypothetical protein
LKRMVQKIPGMPAWYGSEPKQTELEWAECIRTQLPVNRTRGQHYRFSVGFFAVQNRFKH